MVLVFAFKNRELQFVEQFMQTVSNFCFYITRLSFKLSMMSIKLDGMVLHRRNCCCRFRNFAINCLLDISIF